MFERCQGYPQRTMATHDSYEAGMYKMLDAETTAKYHIEYEGFKTNHMSQALYALLILRAPLEKVENFVEWMKRQKLEDYRPYKDRETDKNLPDDVFQILGTQTAYYHIYEYYVKLLKDKHAGSLEGLIAEEFPRLSQGVVGAAFHGLIHLGYGYASGRSWFVCEGLAYLHDSYERPVYKNKVDINILGTGTLDILDVVMKLHDDTELIEFMHEASHQYQKEHTGTFGSRLSALFELRGDRLLEYVNMVRFPEGLDAKSLVKDEVVRLANWIIDCCIIVYTIAETKNDFFLLHAVTSSWALKQVLPLLANCQDVLETVQAYLVSVFAVYLIQNSPALDRSLLEKNDGLSYSWEELIQKAVDHEDLEKEHMYKITQVCKLRSQENPNGGLESMYRLAAHNCVTYPWDF